MFCACLCVFFSLKIHTPSTFAFHVSRRFDFNFEISSELKLKVYLSSVTVNPEEKKNNLDKLIHVLHNIISVFSCGKSKDKQKMIIITTESVLKVFL